MYGKIGTLKNTVSDERIDVNHTMMPMSHNMLGHEERMKALCEQKQREYFDSGLHEKEDRSWTQNS